MMLLNTLVFGDDLSPKEPQAEQPLETYEPNTRPQAPVGQLMTVKELLEKHGHDLPTEDDVDFLKSESFCLAEHKDLPSIRNLMRSCHVFPAFSIFAEVLAQFQDYPLSAPQLELRRKLAIQQKFYRALLYVLVRQGIINEKSTYGEIDGACAIQQLQKKGEKLKNSFCQQPTHYSPENIQAFNTASKKLAQNLKIFYKIMDGQVIACCCKKGEFETLRHKLMSDMVNKIHHYFVTDEDLELIIDSGILLVREQQVDENRLETVYYKGLSDKGSSSDLLVRRYNGLDADCPFSSNDGTDWYDASRTECRVEEMVSYFDGFLTVEGKPSVFLPFPKKPREWKLIMSAALQDCMKQAKDTDCPQEVRALLEDEIKVFCEDKEPEEVIRLLHDEARDEALQEMMAANAAHLQLKEKAEAAQVKATKNERRRQAYEERRQAKAATHAEQSAAAAAAAEEATVTSPKEDSLKMMTSTLVKFRKVRALLRHIVLNSPTKQNAVGSHQVLHAADGSAPVTVVRPHGRAHGEVRASKFRVLQALFDRMQSQTTATVRSQLPSSVSNDDD